MQREKSSSTNPSLRFHFTAGTRELEERGGWENVRSPFPRGLNFAHPWQLNEKLNRNVASRRDARGSNSSTRLAARGGPLTFNNSMSTLSLEQRARSARYALPPPCPRHLQPLLYLKGFFRLYASGFLVVHQHPSYDREPRKRASERTISKPEGSDLVISLPVRGRGQSPGRHRDRVGVRAGVWSDSEVQPSGGRRRRVWGPRGIIAQRLVRCGFQADNNPPTEQSHRLNHQHPFRDPIDRPSPQPIIRGGGSVAMFSNADPHCRSDPAFVAGTRPHSCVMSSGRGRV